jgi:AcrR family transcriptional regulator
VADAVKARRSSRCRPYESSLRREQAEATRQRVLDAALLCFRDSGYAATSVRAIADQAGVAVQTLYQSWGSKPALVEGLLRRVKERIDLPGQFAAMANGAHDPRRLLAGSAHITRRYSEVGWDVLELVRVVAPEVAQVATAWREAEDSRYRGQRQLVQWIADAGALQDGLDVRQAAHTLWTLSTHDVYRLYVGIRRNRPAAFERWLLAITTDLLITR